MNTLAKPAMRPARPEFSSGPCAKRPGWTTENLRTAILGRSHRSKVGKSRLQAAIDQTRAVLQVPADYLVGIVPGSDTGAVEMALWSMLGPRPVQLLAFESFGKDWVTDVVKQLKIEAEVLDAPYGKLPDLGKVRADADLPSAVENLVDGAFFNSGQSCCGIERIYVARPLFKDFVEAFRALTLTYRLGDPLNPSTTLGPMVRASAARFVEGQIAEAVSAGARALISSGAFPAVDPESAYLAPQVLVDVDHTMRVMREETFGPAVGIMPVDDDAQAVALMNDSDLGLTASLWTRDTDRAEVLGGQIETGTVFLNRCDYLDPDLAWTGVKNTGRGYSLSLLGYGQLTRAKSYNFGKAQ